MTNQQLLAYYKNMLQVSDNPKIKQIAQSHIDHLQAKIDLDRTQNEKSIIQKLYEIKSKQISLIYSLGLVSL